MINIIKVHFVFLLFVSISVNILDRSALAACVETGVYGNNQYECCPRNVEPSCKSNAVYYESCEIESVPASLYFCQGVVKNSFKIPSRVDDTPQDYRASNRLRVLDQIAAGNFEDGKRAAEVLVSPLQDLESTIDALLNSFNANAKLRGIFPQIDRQEVSALVQQIEDKKRKIKKEKRDLAIKVDVHLRTQSSEAADVNFFIDPAGEILLHFPGAKLGKGGFKEVFVGMKYPEGKLVANAILSKTMTQRHLGLLNQELEIMRKMVTPEDSPFYFEFKDQDQNLHRVISQKLYQGNLWTIVHNNDVILNQKQIGDRIIKSLNNLHKKGYLHLDIKPENIFYNVVQTGKRKNPEYFPEVGDFGLSLPKEGTEKQLLPNRGTSSFYSPETVALTLKKNEVHATAPDIWAVGLTLYAMTQEAKARSEKGDYWPCNQGKYYKNGKRDTQLAFEGLQTIWQYSQDYPQSVDYWTVLCDQCGMFCGGRPTKGTPENRVYKLLNPNAETRVKYFDFLIEKVENRDPHPLLK